MRRAVVLFGACALAACGSDTTGGTTQQGTPAADGAVSGPDGGPADDARRPVRDAEFARVDGAPSLDAVAPLDAAARPETDVFVPTADATAPEPDAADPALDAATGLPCVATVALDGFEIFAYEASHPDATALDRGVEPASVCSRPGVLPWTDLTVAQAQAACATIGFALCTNAQWQSACAGPDMNLFPYGGPHVDALCNDHIAGGNALEPTGSRPDCHTPTGIYDQSGNVWEMTADGERRGGSWRVNASTYQQEYAGCFESLFINEQYADADLGFRCCRLR